MPSLRNVFRNVNYEHCRPDTRHVSTSSTQATGYWSLPSRRRRTCPRPTSDPWPAASKRQHRCDNTVPPPRYGYIVHVDEYVRNGILPAPTFSATRSEPRSRSRPACLRPPHPQVTCVSDGAALFWHQDSEPDCTHPGNGTRRSGSLLALTLADLPSGCLDRRSSTWRPRGHRLRGGARLG
jgi:hypothetical protein